MAHAIQCEASTELHKKWQQQQIMPTKNDIDVFVDSNEKVNGNSQNEKIKFAENNVKRAQPEYLCIPFILHFEHFAR